MPCDSPQTCSAVQREGSTSSYTSPPEAPPGSTRVVHLAEHGRQPPGSFVQVQVHTSISICRMHAVKPCLCWNHSRVNQWTLTEDGALDLQPHRTAALSF